MDLGSAGRCLPGRVDLTVGWTARRASKHQCWPADQVEAISYSLGNENGELARTQRKVDRSRNVNPRLRFDGDFVW